jgi:glycerophosphoryl diester phosphodiesterase
MVIAHRGGSKLRPENTMVAFANAVALGVDALECDVHLSRDGEVVVIHDPTLDRTTNASGPVGDRTASELARVDAGHHFRRQPGAPFDGEAGGVPRLADLLDAFPTSLWSIEVKGDRPETAERALDVVRAAGAEARVILGGFSHVVLDVVRRRAPELLTGASSREVQSALRWSYLGLGPRRPRFQAFQVPFRLRGRQIFGRRFVRAALGAALPVHAWIVDEETDMRQLLGWGVSGLITDRPDIALVVKGTPGHE